MSINFKPIHTTTEKLSTIPVVDGQFILVKDMPAIFADMQNDRFKVADTKDYEVIDIDSGNIVGDLMKGCDYNKTYGFYIQKQGQGYTQYRTNLVDFAKISKLTVKGSVNNSGGSITNRGYIYITDDENAIFDSATWKLLKESTTTSHTSFTYELDTSNYSGNKYIYFVIQHGDERDSYTSYLYISSINCVYSLNILEGLVKYIPGNGISFIPNEDASVTIENTGAQIEIINDYWYINGVNTDVKAIGTDGKSPTIEIDPDTKMWIINGTSTGIVAESESITKSEYQDMINLLDSINSKIEQVLDTGV